MKCRIIQKYEDNSDDDGYECVERISVLEDYLYYVLIISDSYGILSWRG